MTRWVLHVDLDMFLAAVEILRKPELAGKPVVVGGRGDPTERAVVSTASYEARAHGVRSGLALRLAKRRCPDAVFLPVDFPVYEEASARVMETLRSVPGAVVEVLGWDEAFVGVETDDPVATAREIQAAVLEATGRVERSDVLAAEVILAQLRSIVVDLLLLTGLDQMQSTDALPPPR